LLETEILEKICSNNSLICFSNIAIFYFGFLANPKIKNENGSIECKQDVEKLAESENILKMIFYANDSLNDDLESEL